MQRCNECEAVWDSRATMAAVLNDEVRRLQREINKQDDEISRLRSLIDWKN